MDRAFGRFAVDEALTAVLGLLEEANRHLVRTAPWTLLKTGEKTRADAALRTSLETLRVIAEEIIPRMHTTGDEFGAPGSAPPARRLSTGIRAPGASDAAPGEVDVCQLPT